jgi:hypothetical protein
MSSHATDAKPAELGAELPLPPALLQELRQALQTIRYGTIELVIHNGRVVQLELREKVRIDHEVTDHRRHQ